MRSDAVLVFVGSLVVLAPLFGLLRMEGSAAESPAVRKTEGDGYVADSISAARSDIGDTHVALPSEAKRRDGEGVDEPLWTYHGPFAKRLRSLFGNLFRVSVEFSGNYFVSKRELLEVLRSGGEPLTFPPSSEEIDRRMRTHPWVDSVDLNWKFYPLRLGVGVHEAEPWLVAELGSGSWLISRNGDPLCPLDDIELPELVLLAASLPRLDGVVLPSGVDNARPLSANARFEYALKMLLLIELATQDSELEIERYTLLPEGDMLLGPSDAKRYPEVLIDVESLDEARLAVRRIEEVLQDLEERGEKAQRLDLRFDGKVIVGPSSAK